MSYAGPENTEVKAETSGYREEAEDKPPYDDQTMVNMIRVEMQRSVGFENDQTLKADRLRALDYYKGDMRADVPSLPNRSRAVSTDVADAVETILPDIMEIFTAGGDVAVFEPVKPGDEDSARQETDYLNHVIFQDNPGFLNLMTGFKDGLLLKTCLFEFAWRKDYEDEDFTGKTLPELIQASQDGESQITNVKAEPQDPDYPSAQQTYSFTARRDCSKAEYWAHPPDDFSVSPDTVRIADTTYCVSRSRPRVQDLIAEGYDEDVVLKLEPYAPTQDQQLQQAKDTAGEHQQSQQTDSTTDMLRQVEIRKHYIRLKDKNGDDFDIWRVVTNSTADIIVPYEGQSCTKMQRIPFAGGSPYLVAHRFYGLSVAEQLIETQKIKTVFTRMLADSGYFALNQRYEVAMDQANDYTISDLLRNEPAVPVRSKTGNAVRPLSAGGLGFDAYAALEYFSTVGEMRSGVVRNAQGLNPDTLHDTAKGAMALMQAAQRRVRMIARVLAETCVKELYLGLHSLIRENAEASTVARLNGKWVPIDPTSWGERNAMTIEVGLGASGREADIAAFNALSQDMQAVALSPVGPMIIKPENVYNLAIDKAKAYGRKQPERYYTDPAGQPPPQAAPDPKLITAQMQAEQKAQATTLQEQTKQRGQDIQAVQKQRQTEAEAVLKKYEIDQANATNVATALIDGHVKHAVAKVGIGGNQI